MSDEYRPISRELNAIPRKRTRKKNKRSSKKETNGLDAASELTMNKIEKFIEKRDYINKRELDLVVRNLIENPTNKVFPDSTAKPPILQCVNRVPLKINRHMITPPRMCRENNCILPSIESKEKIRDLVASNPDICPKARKKLPGLNGKDFVSSINPETQFEQNTSKLPTNFLQKYFQE